MRKTVKQGIANILVTLILVALLNLIIFAAMRPWKLDEANRLAFWFSYGALMLAFILRSVSLFLGRRDSSDRRIHTGLPLAFSALLYFGTTLLLSFLYMILSVCGVKVPFALPLITLVLILGFYLIVLILHLAARPEARCTATMDSPLLPLSDRVRALTASASDAILARKLEQLTHDILTAPASADLAAALKPGVEQLEASVAAGDRLGAARAVAAIRSRLDA